MNCLHCQKFFPGSAEPLLWGKDIAPICSGLLQAQLGLVQLFTMAVSLALVFKMKRSSAVGNASVPIMTSFSASKTHQLVQGSGSLSQVGDMVSVVVQKPGMPPHLSYPLRSSTALVFSEDDGQALPFLNGLGLKLSYQGRSLFSDIGDTSLISTSDGTLERTGVCPKWPSWKLFPSTITSSR